MKKYLIILFILLMIIQTGCAKTVYDTKIEYITPDIPVSMLEPCRNVELSFNTNSELLNSFISLHSAYLECSAKVNSISLIIKSYKDIYTNYDPEKE